MVLFIPVHPGGIKHLIYIHAHISVVYIYIYMYAYKLHCINSFAVFLSELLFSRDVNILVSPSYINTKVSS